MRSAPNTNPRDEHDLLVSASIPPHEMLPVVVGEYETAELIPKLAIEHQPDGWDIIEWVENRQILSNGTIRLVLFVQNFGAQVEKIYVRRAKQ